MPSAQHTFRRDIQPHYYYPTLYAMLGTGSNRQVYLPAASAQVQVFMDTEMGLTSGKDEYTFSRSGNNLLVTLENSSGTFYQTFAPGELPRTLLQLGQGGDTVTIDFTNDDPLEFTQLMVCGMDGAGNVIRVIGSADADTISVLGLSSAFIPITVNGRQFATDAAVSVYLDGAGGDDYLRSTSFRPVTLAGGAGNDTIELPAGKASLPEALDGGDGIDTVIGASGPDEFDEGVEYFRTTSAGQIFVNRYDHNNTLLFSVAQQPGGHTVFDIKEAACLGSGCLRRAGLRLRPRGAGAHRHRQLACGERRGQGRRSLY